MATTDHDILLAVDGGKTKFAVGLFTPSLELIDVQRIPASDPPACLAALERHVAELSRHHAIRQVGLSLFGPLELDRTRPGYGDILGSSLPAWTGVNVPALLRRATGGRPVRFDFDVSAGAAAEARLGVAVGLDDFVYLSIGTGVGAAIRSGGRWIRGVDGPQVGHAFVPREPDDPYPGNCRFHGACLQGLASGSALRDRWGVSAESLPADHPAWDLEARYVARACVNLLYALSPARVLLGSGVARAPGLVDAVNRYVPQYMNGFPASLTRRFSAAERPVEAAALPPDSSLWGAAMLATEETVPTKERDPV